MESDEDYLAQASRQAKRHFLLEEIVTPGYLPETFTYYCELGKGSDIDQWTFEELQRAVADFKDKFNPGQLPPTEDEVIVQQPQSAPTVTEPVKKVEPLTVDTTSVARSKSPVLDGKKSPTGSPTLPTDETVYTLQGRTLPATALSDYESVQFTMGL